MRDSPARLQGYISADFMLREFRIHYPVADYNSVYNIITSIGTAEATRQYDNVSNYVKGIPDSLYYPIINLSP